MKFWKTLVRSVLEEYGLVGRFLADKIDGGESSFDGQVRTERATNFSVNASTERGATLIAPASPYRPPQEILYQVLTNNTWWRTVGFGINVSTAVAEGLNRLKNEYPDVPVRAVDKNTQALIDIRT